MRKFADNETTKAQLEAIYKYVGAEDGNLNVEQHEYFARSFEAYLMDGRSPNQLLSKVFARFKKWMRNRRIFAYFYKELFILMVKICLTTQVFISAKSYA